MAASNKFIPGSDSDAFEIFKYPFLDDEETKEYIKNHRKIMFIVRGPPGTGKKSLTDLLLQNYPSAIKCSADDYFTKTFAPSLRTKESLKESHEYCHRRSKQECIKGTHPVIVSNTHMKKAEMQVYLNYAEEYGYTVIIAETVDKFKISPEILAKSNTKGLNKKYFENRLKAWENVLPLLIGWFLNIEDSFYLLHQLQYALDALLGDGRFCSVFDAYDKDNLLKKYKAKEVLFCVAGFSKTSCELMDYYKSDEVKESYGKCFTITVQAYVITQSDIFAVVELNEELKSHIFSPSFENHSSDEDDISAIANSFRAMSLWNSYKFKLIPLEGNFSGKCNTASLTDKSSDYLKTNEITFIHVAQNHKKKFSSWEMYKLFRSSFDGVDDDLGELPAHEFVELDDGYKFCRLANDAWVIRPPRDLLVKTVFTGLYI